MTRGSMRRKIGKYLATATALGALFSPGTVRVKKKNVSNLLFGKTAHSESGGKSAEKADRNVYKPVMLLLSSEYHVSGRLHDPA